jgi:serine/threonine protein kinase
VDTLGPYRIVRRLGSGGMGVVHEAWDTGLERPVALKVISPQLADDPVFRERFTREARAQAALTSEHVVHVYAHGEDAGQLWIATQLVPDGDLGRLLREHGAPPALVALDLIAQVASGLADAHSAGLVHRDIKPANVLVRRGPRIRAYLCDFGIARPLGSEATSTGTIGTPSYMAPELHTGGTAGVASDVYSLGCLLWAALSGRAPYGGTSDYEVVSAHLEQPVPQLAGASPQSAAVNRVLRTAMAKRPEDRYPTAAAMRDDLLAAAPLRGAPPPVVDVPTRGRRLAIVAAVVVLVLAVAAGAAYALTRGDGGAPAAEPTSTPSAQVSSPPSTPSARDEARAAAAFADALVRQGAMTANQADCVATTVVDDVGLDQLIEDGFFDADLAFLDPDLADKPAIKDALTSASFDCLT